MLARVMKVVETKRRLCFEEEKIIISAYVGVNQKCKKGEGVIKFTCKITMTIDYCRNISRILHATYI